MSAFKTFESARLFIRPTADEDASFLLKLFNTPKWLEYIGDRNVHTEEEAREYVRNKMEAQLQRLGFANYTLIRKSDQEKMGVCGLYDRPGMEGIDLGFAFLPEYEHQGYGYEGAKVVTTAAFEVFQLELLKAITLPRNLPSQKLLKKLGFSEKGTIRVANDDEELMLFTLSHEDYFQQKSFGP